MRIMESFYDDQEFSATGNTVEADNINHCTTQIESENNISPREDTSMNKYTCQVIMVLDHSASMTEMPVSVSLQDWLEWIDEQHEEYLFSHTATFCPAAYDEAIVKIPEKSRRRNVSHICTIRQIWITFRRKRRRLASAISGAIERRFLPGVVPAV